MRRAKSSDAIEILHRRYIGTDPQRAASLQEERVNAQVARIIRELRESAGQTQKQLAEAVGTTQSVISRLEDADYEGHSLTMLDRIARALNQQVNVVRAGVPRKQGARSKRIPAGSAPRKSLYESDYNSWVLDQARALRDHQGRSLDWENLAVEVEALVNRKRGRPGEPKGTAHRASEGHPRAVPARS